MVLYKEAVVENTITYGLKIYVNKTKAAFP